MPTTNIKGLDRRVHNGGKDIVREAVRRRDGYKCYLCEKKWKEGERRFDVHHLNNLCGKKSRKYDRVSETNFMITLCHRCHLSQHQVRGRMSVQIWDPVKTKKRNTSIIKLRKSGWAYPKLAKKFNISEARCWKIVKDYS